MERSATFEEQPFAHGRFRAAYRGVWTAPPSDVGKKCVVKRLKKSYTWTATDWNETLRINERAKTLAAGFNTAAHTNKPISFTDVHVLKVYQPAHMRYEYVTCEDFIPGPFNKWCNNYGYIADESVSLPAFMHWSWYETSGEEMVSDLQGVRNQDSFKLTDPAMMSLSQKYGATDTGVEGMAMFFLNHKCNDFCQHLPKPTLAHFHRIISQEYLKAAKTLMAQIRNSTTYKQEIIFPPSIHDRVAAKFREIANS